MTSTTAGRVAIGLFAALALGGCAGTPPPATTSPSAGPSATTEPASTNRPASYTAADVAFMSNMIHHHAQAVLIAGWAPSHEASPALQRLAERVVVGQQDEIALMQRWLRHQGKPVPDPAAPHHTAGGMNHSMHSMDMPGMLSPAELALLDAAKGRTFDRLFLTFMIRHHQGALTMVNELFDSPGAAQDATVYRLAADVYADQSTEIRRMQGMLAQLPPTSD